MNYQSETVILHETFIDEMIDSCFTVDKYVKVRDKGSYWAELRYRKYTFHNQQGTFTKQKNVLQLKRIFHKLIAKYNAFEHEGYDYYRHNGQWYKYKIRKNING
ncbi:hypothetical protein U6A24_12665 [Aquimarina gracilis]|uniref:Uncharacterized protein n=1 Tax=Aquimarina gracilis TaxID=874422 RepID=A0ABU5ZWT0_9FLAO|nr:hypothetical protein [Aquimarina gracilis]MEB3346322.1 hypothetical protein [Aquimarina gracilis]